MSMIWHHHVDRRLLEVWFSATKQMLGQSVNETFVHWWKLRQTNQQAAVINFTEHCNWPALTFHLGPKRTHNTLAHICTPTSHRNTIIRLASIYTITLAVYHTITVARYHTAWQPQRGHRHCHLQSYGAIKDHTAHVAFHSLTLNEKRCMTRSQ